MSSLLSLSMILFVFCLFICFWLLDFTYKWNHEAFVFLCLIYHGSVQSLSHVQLFTTPWTAALQASLSTTISRSLLKPMSTESVMPSSHLILCCSLLLLPSVFPSIRVFPVSQFFASGGQSIGVSASASVLPMNIRD